MRDIGGGDVSLSMCDYARSNVGAEQMVQERHLHTNGAGIILFAKEKYKNHEFVNR